MTETPELLTLLHDIGRLMRLDADRRAAAHGMTRAQWVILIWLERQPGLSQKELAELLEVEPITVARLVDRLADRGMLERRDDPNDRRIWRLHLLPPSLPVLREMLVEKAKMLEQATRSLDPATLRALEQGLSCMKANVIAGLRSRTPDRQLEKDVA